MLKEVLARIEKRLAAVEMSATAASRAAGVSEDAIRNMRRAVKDKTRTGVSTTTLAALAPVLKPSVGWLLNGDGPESVDGPRMVPLIGLVGAGSEATFEQADLGEVAAPEGASDDTVAVEISGTSLGPLFDHWIIFYDQVRRPVTTDLYGRLCVVGLINGKVLVKRIRPARTRGFFHLDSNTEPTINDQEIEWAARVLSMTPR